MRNRGAPCTMSGVTPSSGPSGSAEPVPPGIDPTKAHPSRRYNYWLGGKDNFAVDRESAEMVATGFPRSGWPHWRTEHSSSAP